MDGNAFGKLVQAYRKQRGWKQEDLAQHWGFTREYVSQIERGKRTLDNKQEQVNRLADILGIPEERLASIGKGTPQRKFHASTPADSDDMLLQALIEPAQTTIKLSWLVWRADGITINVGESLKDLEVRLTQALGLYRGQFHKPALRLLAYTHEMLGKLAIERTATREAVYQFQEMYDIAEELGDSDLLATSLIHQAEMFRRRGRYEASFRRMEAAQRFIQEAPENYAQTISPWIQGVLWKAFAINSFVYGDEQAFLRSIEHAEEIASNTAATIDTLNNEFDLVEVLQTKAQGYTMLKKPEMALEIYKQTDKLRPFRPLRDQSSYHIIKAQAYCYAGDLKNGSKHALTGLKMAETLSSARYATRLKQMSDRLSVTPLGEERIMKEVRGEILDVLQRLKDEQS